MKNFITCFVLSCWCLAAYSQKDLEYIPGELLIQFHDEAAFRAFEADRSRSSLGLEYQSIVSEDFRLHLYTFEASQTGETDFLRQVQTDKNVLRAGYNFRLQYRSLIPDDTFYSDQWNMDRIDAPDAWELTTSGQTADGDDIVLALLEGGDTDHEDIQGNIWVNKDEIPDDGIDNDGNGYIDDYNGVNVVDSTDTPIVDNHATSVMGLMGARGNNMMGIAGVNWNTKIMIVSHNLNFAKIVESYEYVYRMRKAWNDSNGEAGAFVVATNASFGADSMKPDDNPIFPIWCEMYDKLGAIGVLNIAATTNANTSIDDIGDMPSFCSSNYLLTITETDINDELDAGYSQTHIDLASPGQNVYTLKMNDNYGTFGGTSAAAPVATGAVGLMYSLPCMDLPVAYREDPAATALLMKQLIMDSADEITDLLDKTVSGGRLNLYRAMQALQNQYGSEKGSLEITNIFPNPTLTGAFKVDYRTPDFTEYDVKIYNAVGQLIYQETLPEVCAPRYIDIDLGRIAGGIYFLSIENANDVQTAKFSVF